MLYLYLNYKKKNEQTYDHLVGSLLKQITAGSDLLSKEIMQLYERRVDLSRFLGDASGDALETDEADVDEEEYDFMHEDAEESIPSDYRSAFRRILTADSALHKLLESKQKAYVVVDAFNECATENDQHIRLLRLLTESLPNNTRVLISSNKRPPVNEKSIYVYQLQIDEKDIRLYAAKRIERRKSELRFLKTDPSLKKEIISAIASNANGM